MTKLRELRRTYENAGVLIEIVKWDNIFNFSDILTRNNTFGSSLGRPLSIVNGRLFQFSGKLSF